MRECACACKAGDDGCKIAPLSLLPVLLLLLQPLPLLAAQCPRLAAANERRQRFALPERLAIALQQLRVGVWELWVGRSGITGAQQRAQWRAGLHRTVIERKNMKASMKSPNFSVVSVWSTRAVRSSRRCASWPTFARALATAASGAQRCTSA